jgi:hypothetical protein
MGIISHSVEVNPLSYVRCWLRTLFFPCSGPLTSTSEVSIMRGTSSMSCSHLASQSGINIHDLNDGRG